MRHAVRAIPRVVPLATALLLAACAGTPAPKLEELALRSTDACGIPWEGDAPRADIAIAIDTSQSTARPAGTDVDGDGVTGRFTRSIMTDPGDSILAAQVSAVRSFLRGDLPHESRFALVTYAGSTRFPAQEPPLRLVSSADGRVRAGLTDELDPLEATLGRVLARGSRGKTDFAAALQLALRTLEGAPASGEERRRIVFFLSDSPNPVLALPSESWIVTSRRRAYPGGQLAHLARRALRSGVAIHTFGLGAAARAEPPHALSSLANVSGGAYRAVDDATRLHCALLAALAP